MEKQKCADRKQQVKTSGKAIPLVLPKPAVQCEELQIATKCQIKDSRCFLQAEGNRKRERMEMGNAELRFNSLYIFQEQLSTEN